MDDLHELAKVYAASYASPHHITFTLDGLKSLIAALSQPAAQGDSDHSAGGECGSVPAPTRQKLTPAQVDLFQAMERGMVVHFISGIGAHYFRTDHKRVSSATVNALIGKGLAERVNKDWRGCIVKLKATP